MEEFFQTPPSLGNSYEYDQVLKSYLKLKLPHEVFTEIEPDLRQLGHRVVGDIQTLGQAAEAEPPRHVPYDPWGLRIDEIQVSAAWKELDRISAEEKLIAIGYERSYEEFSRIYQFAKLYLFHPSSAIYTCPLAMTDGAARVLEVYGGEDRQLMDAYRRLTSPNPERFWTSGQWMTERTGGSDVSGTSTIAKLQNGQYRLYGTKWFTSATTSQMAMTLARIEGAPGGSRGLSLFYVETRDTEGKLKNIRVNRLKDKLGTCALPTAELTLEGVPALLVGGEGDGVKKISTLFNITRIYNACCSVGYMRRGLALAVDYSKKRSAFGRLLSEQPLHQATLHHLQTEFEAAFCFVFRAVELLGKVETNKATPAEGAVLRLLTPLIKLYTGKQAVAFSSEVLEAFGGAGYVEDTGLPRLLRDSQVLAIWEGTTNILSLDVLRAIKKENAAIPFVTEMKERLEKIHLVELGAMKAKVKDAINQLDAILNRLSQMSEDACQAEARQLAYSLSQVYIAGLLLERAQDLMKLESDKSALSTATEWCRRSLISSCWSLLK